ncbi:hypothetical protein J3F84DRAFT_20137 [Trichoderma pleuroticola]
MKTLSTTTIPLHMRVILQTNKLPLPKCFGKQSTTSNETLHVPSRMGCLFNWSSSPIRTHTDKQTTTSYFFKWSTSSNQTRSDQTNQTKWRLQNRKARSCDPTNILLSRMRYGICMIVTGDKRKHLSLSGFNLHHHKPCKIPVSCVEGQTTHHLFALDTQHWGKHSHTFVRGYHDLITFLPSDKQNRGHFHKTLSRKTVRMTLTNGEMRRDQNHESLSWSDPPPNTHIINGELGRGQELYQQRITISRLTLPNTENHHISRSHPILITFICTMILSCVSNRIS